MTGLIMDFKGNCGPIAIKEVSGKTDEEVLAACRKNGYDGIKKGGMYTNQIVKSCHDLGLKVASAKFAWHFTKAFADDENWQTSKFTIRKFLKAVDYGVWLVFLPNHVFVVRAGKLVDINFKYRSHLGRRVTSAYQIMNPHSPEVKGHVKIIRDNPRRRGTRGSVAYAELKSVVRASPTATKEQILAMCYEYNATDFAWDLKRGNIAII